MTTEQINIELEKYLNKCLANKIIDSVENYSISLSKYNFNSLFNKVGLNYSINAQVYIEKEFKTVHSIECENIEKCLLTFKMRLESEVKINNEQKVLIESINNIKDEKDLLMVELKLAEDSQDYEKSAEIKIRLDNWEV